MTANNENKELAKGSVHRQWISSLLASTLCFTYGLQSGWMSPAIPILQSAYSPSGYPLSSIEISWIASALCISAMLTCLPHSRIVDRFGRKFALINCAVLQTVGFMIKLISAHPISLLISQTFCGIASGGIFIVMPLYIKEISTDALRGILGTVYMLLQSVGILTMYALGAFFSFNTVLWLVVWIPIINIIGLLMAPESPGYLVKKGKVDEAVSVMAYLRCADVDNKELQVELQRIRNEVAQFENSSKITLRTIYSDKAARRASALAIFILTMLDMSGNFAIFSYASMIIRSSGVTFKPEAQSMILPIVMIAGGLTSTVTVERCGRKPLMLSGMIVIGTSMCTLASILLMQEKEINVHWSLPMLCIICSVFCHGTTLPVPYVVMSEIFNVQVRGKIMGYIVTFGWFEVFLQLFVFAPVSEYLGMYTMFYIFSGINLIGSVAVYILMPETKGKSLKEIEKELVGENK